MSIAQLCIVGTVIIVLAVIAVAAAFAEALIEFDDDLQGRR